jgi:hypothetical protein
VGSSAPPHAQPFSDSERLTHASTSLATCGTRPRCKLFPVGLGADHDPALRALKGNVEINLDTTLD